MRSRISPRIVCLLAAFLGTGCSSGNDSSSDEPVAVECAIELDVSGAEEKSVAWNEYACAYTSSDNGVYLVYLNVDGGSVTLEIDDIRIDEVGEFSGSLRLDFEGSGVYAADCTFTVESQTLAEDAGDPDYVVAGSGTCPAGGTEIVTGESITIEDFSFSALTTWRIDP